MQTNLITFRVEEMDDQVVYQANIDGNPMYVISLNSETVLGSDYVARVMKTIDLDLSRVLIGKPGVSVFKEFFKIGEPEVLGSKFQKISVPECLVKLHRGEIEKHQIAIDGLAIEPNCLVEVNLLDPWCWLEVDEEGYDFECNFSSIDPESEPRLEPQSTIELVEETETAETPAATVTKKDGKLVLEIDLNQIAAKHQTREPFDSITAPNAEAQYREMLRDLLENGEWVENPRTKVRCLTGLNYTIKMNPRVFPAITSRKLPWRAAIKEMLGYMQGFTTLEDFHRLGVNTWDANCEAWKPIDPKTGNIDTNLKSHGGDLGLIYGASAEAVGMGYQEILNKLRNYESRYDRGIIWSFWNPAYFHMGCLRPCMMMHQFNVIGDTLHLTSYQRSQDVPLGGAFNLIQAWVLLQLTARFVGLEVGTVTLHISNAHIYENQLDGVYELLAREPRELPVLEINESIQNFADLREITADNFGEFFQVDGYDPHPAIKFPFTA